MAGSVAGHGESLRLQPQFPTKSSNVRAARSEGDSLEPSEEYLRELNEAYQHFFFHYSSTPLLVVETSQLDLAGSDEALDDLIRQINSMGRGTQYYVPRT